MSRLVELSFLLLVVVSCCVRATLVDVPDRTLKECLVQMEQDTGDLVQCWNCRCDEYIDPWKIRHSTLDGEPCAFHYLKLAFTSFDQFFIFAEYQHIRQHFYVEEFFTEKEGQPTMLDLKVQTFYPLNDKAFVNKELLNQLGQTKVNIKILQIRIERWYQSNLSVPQIIEDDMMESQPFEQISLIFPCNQHQSVEQWILTKLSPRTPSPCEEQVRFRSQLNNQMLPSSAAISLFVVFTAFVVIVLLLIAFVTRRDLFNF